MMLVSLYCNTIAGTIPRTEKVRSLGAVEYKTNTTFEMEPAKRYGSFSEIEVEIERENNRCKRKRGNQQYWGSCLRMCALLSLPHWKMLESTSHIGSTIWSLYRLGKGRWPERVEFSEQFDAVDRRAHWRENSKKVLHGELNETATTYSSGLV